MVDVQRKNDLIVQMNNLILHAQRKKKTRNVKLKKGVNMQPKKPKKDMQ